MLRIRMLCGYKRIHVYNDVYLKRKDNENLFYANRFRNESTLACQGLLF